MERVHSHDYSSAITNDAVGNTEIMAEIAEHVKTLSIYFGYMIVLVTLVTVIPLMVCLFPNVDITMGKGDQRILGKMYLFNSQTLPHLCQNYNIAPADSGYLEVNAIVLDAYALSKRPTYSEQFSTYSLLEMILLDYKQIMYLAYFLPGFSRVNITTCGKTWNDTGTDLTIAIFDNLDRLNKWMSETRSGRLTCTSCPNMYAHFSACPFNSSFQLDLTNHTDKQWYFAFSSYEYDNTVLTSVHFEFTKYLLEFNKYISNCTATAEHRCYLPAPDQDEIYIVLEMLTLSTSIYPVTVNVNCHSYDQASYIVYFLVLPLSSAVVLALLCFASTNLQQNCDCATCSYKTPTDDLTPGELMLGDGTFRSREANTAQLSQIQNANDQRSTSSSVVSRARNSQYTRNGFLHQINNTGVAFEERRMPATNVEHGASEDVETLEQSDNIMLDPPVYESSNIYPPRLLDSTDWFPTVVGREDASNPSSEPPPDYSTVAFKE